MPLVGVRVADHDRARLLLYGPAGIGKSALATALAERADAALVIAPQPADAEVPGAGLAELRAAAGLPCLPTGDGLSGRALAVETVRALAGLLVVDNAQWLDPVSAELIGFAIRHAPGLRVVVAERANRRPARGVAVLGAEADRGPLPPLSPDDVAELLAHNGFRYRWAGRVHALSGGNPGLALEFGAALAGREPVAAVPLPDAVRRTIGARLAELDPAVLRTARLAALAERPTLAVLHRAGGVDLAEVDDLVVVDELDGVSFPAGAVAATLTADIPYAQRLDLHRDLAGAVDDPVQRTRHRALAAAEPDPDLADELERAAAVVRDQGNRRLAAELSLLAAQRTPPTDEDTLIRRAGDAAVDAGHSGLAERAWNAARLVLDRSTDPRQRLRVRLALADSAGQAMTDVDDQLAAALADAGDDPDLVAVVRLWEAVRANISAGDPVTARELAREAADLTVHDMAVRARALTVRARMERVLGLPDSSALEEALALSGAGIDVHDTPEYLAVRHAVFDDRLTAARSRLLVLLPAAQRAGAVDDVVDVFRSLAEVEGRAGRCGHALSYARRALELTASAGLSPGPAWYTAAVAETAGGTFERAVAYARRGAVASEQEQDRIYLSRCLHALGVVRLVTAASDEAVSVLSRVRELEQEQQVGDPSILRWHADLAEALIAVGDPAAEPLLVTTRERAVELGRDGVVAMLDRSAGIAAGSAAQLRSVAGRFTALGLLMEAGRTLLALASVQRRARRRGSARSVLAEAAELFDRLDAVPWSALAAQRLRHLDPADGDLTRTEARLAELVNAGATNQQAASALSVSVKTVEATLTRVYRKLGVHSRAQLVARLARR
ncbi:DNA-binding CsgD family transcriptional regulator [Actinokineospora baliensis]|uniref:helix-turn-helix transcriptional regulator n=1 Tax=Actinokineospora baliensis TaxID=547056 RepID=UPI00195BBC11|nr:LuxR C-terminal-related transcriptional regulator [Actinokineospora baliensis]MBM7773937.1 DNA-binding CsgD family transcriptional regulator [Actinokineospora baliensis]